MNFEKKEITKNLLLLLFENQFDVSSTFLRFQEYYESPKFRGKVFTLDDFKEWYSSFNGDFTYYTDWNGFNIPSYVLKPFYEGKFNPLSENEKTILNLFENVESSFYVIATHKKVENLDDYLKHEIAHGLYYTDSQYKSTVLDILSEFNLVDFKNRLSNTGGYHEDVLLDEVHAHSIDLDEDYIDLIPKDLHEKLLRNYQKGLEKNKICFFDLKN